MSKKNCHMKVMGSVCMCIQGKFKFRGMHTEELNLKTGKT